MILLDTHIWIWWVNGDADRLKPAWISRIECADIVGVSAISVFEVAWLARHGRIDVAGSIHDWFDKALGGSSIELQPMTPMIAASAVALPEHHRDPQDRIIIATALHHRAALLSADSKFPQYTELADLLVP